MRVIKYTAISLSLLLLAGCSDDKAVEVKAPVINSTERLAPVSLQIPGVGSDTAIPKVMGENTPILLLIMSKQ